MARQVAVVVLHGIGSPAKEFDDPRKRFDHTLKKKVTEHLGSDFAFVAWQPVLWSDVKLEEAQEQLLDENDKDLPLFGDGLTSFAVKSLADASAYQYYGKTDPRFPTSNYLTVNGLVLNALEKCAKSLEDPDKTPMVVIAQSMGCHVISNYQWDASRDPERIVGVDGDHTRLTPFTALKTLCGLYFTGCNLPILTMGVPREGKVPIQVPGAVAPKLFNQFDRNIHAVWKNYYDPDDVLGYALESQFAPFFDGKGTSDVLRSPNQIAVDDCKIELRSLAGLTPLAHIGYWKSSRITKDIADMVRTLIHSVGP